MATELSFSAGAVKFMHTIRNLAAGHPEATFKR